MYLALSFKLKIPRRRVAIIATSGWAQIIPDDIGALSTNMFWWLQTSLSWNLMDG